MCSDDAYCFNLNETPRCSAFHPLPHCVTDNQQCSQTRDFQDCIYNICLNDALSFICLYISWRHCAVHSACLPRWRRVTLLFIQTCIVSHSAAEALISAVTKFELCAFTVHADIDNWWHDARRTFEKVLLYSVRVYVWWQIRVASCYIWVCLVRLTSWVYLLQAAPCTR